MTRSRTISGILCLAAICAPIVIAPIRLKQSLNFVRDIENRQPNAFPEFTSPGNLIDKDWWASISRGFEDRVPFREQMIALDRAMHISGGNNQMSDKVALGVDDWLFLRHSLAKDQGSLDETELAIAVIEEFYSNKTFKAELFVLVSPDKTAIYPEKLGDESRSEYETTLQQRAVLHDWFADSKLSNILDIWTPMLELKSQSADPVYEVGGSHFNSDGAMVMARVMIDAIDPTLWIDDDIINVWTRTQMPELAKMGGFWDRTETSTRTQIKRPTVISTARWINHQSVVPNTKVPDGKGSDQISVRVTNTSDAARLIPGKALIIHDSAIGNYLRPTLIEFFADVEFMHFNDLTPESLRDALNAYDLVYFESVERHFVKRAIHFFGTP
ncbi:MAG: hypothetical protein JKX70_11090 [Phycisphaerales bacterium]|nr:hypothetical protein [Phycisphaerales bacterium]